MMSFEEWVMLKNLRPGAVFVTRDGIYAVKSEYRYSNEPLSQCECVLLASGEYAHFRDGNETLVREVSVERPIEPEEDGNMQIYDPIAGQVIRAIRGLDGGPVLEQ